MVVKASSEAAAEASLPGSKEGAWKWALRTRVWDYMEANDIARCVGERTHH
jgi:5-formyltetrahydrofolate cyclo-ligase